VDRFEEIKKKDILLGTSALKWKKDMYVTHDDYDWLIAEIERLRKIEHDANACADNPSKGAAAIAQNIRLGEEIERLTEELEMSERILENMTGGQDPDEVLNI